MSHGHDHDEHAHRPIWQYLAIAGILAVITAVELGPLFEWYNIPTLGLMVLSIFKFVLVAAIFMHLADDHKFYTQVFGIPLVAAGVMILVLMLLFGSFIPGLRQGGTADAAWGYARSDDSFPVQERYKYRYQGECTSWVTSHRSHKEYCASPKIDFDRVKNYVAPAKSSGPKLAFDTSKPEAELKADLVAAGEKLYTAQCVACHHANGEGVPGAFPPIAGSDYPGYLDPVQHAGIIINGLSGEITVKGNTYNGAMAGFGQLSDEEIAAIATYERNSWGNDHGMVTPEQVAQAR